MRRGSLGWYRYRMISGIIFSLLGLGIAAQLIARPGAPQTKLAGFAFAIVVIALGVVRVMQYLKARSATGTGPAP